MMYKKLNILFRVTIPVLLIIVLVSCSGIVNPIPFNGEVEVLGTKYVYDGEVNVYVVENTPTDVPTSIPTTAVPSNTPTFTPTNTFTAIPTFTSTFTTVPSNTPTRTATATPTRTATSTRTNTPTITATKSPTSTVVYPTPVSTFGYDTGWWVDGDVANSSTITTFAGQGNTLMLLAGWFTSTSQLSGRVTLLNAANSSGSKLIIGLEGGATPTMSDSSMTTVINGLKNNPALFGYYTGDEPELTSDQALIQSRHTTLLRYYNLIKSLDPNHPVMISFNQPYNSTQWSNQAVFYDSVDIIGIHAYPFWSTGGEFGTSEGRTIYDVWARLKTNALNLGKDWACTMQGFGANSGYPYKNPTLAELRYETFTAMALGCPHILFWIDSWGSRSGMLSTVATVINQEQEIGTEMKAGITNDPRITSSVGTDKLIYRFGIGDGRAVLLAVNIANRSSSSGETLNATFTIPTGYSTITVAGENRTVSIVNNKFTDTFSKFQVHIYILK